MKNEAIMKRLRRLTCPRATTAPAALPRDVVSHFRVPAAPEPLPIDMVPRITPRRVDEAIYGIAVELATAVTGVDLCDDLTIAMALREPVSAAALFSDLVKFLQVDPPPVLRLALGEAIEDIADAA